VFANTDDYTFVTKWSKEDNAWVSIVLEFPSLVGRGGTSGEAHHEVYVAAYSILEGMRKNKEVPPKPFTIEDIKKRFSMEQKKVKKNNTLKKDWIMPSSPKCSCGARISPIAHDTGDGVYLGWDDWCSECHNHFDSEGYDDFGKWPFEETVACMKSFEDIGFKIV
jgi:hypothetical protein